MNGIARRAIVAQSRKSPKGPKKIPFHFFHSWETKKDTGKHKYQECRKEGCEVRRIVDQYSGSGHQPVDEKWVNEHLAWIMSDEDKAKCDENPEKYKEMVSDGMKDDHWKGDDITIFRTLMPGVHFPIFKVKMPDDPKDMNFEHLINILYMEIVKAQNSEMGYIKEAREKYGEGKPNRRTHQYMDAVHSYHAVRNVAIRIERILESMVRSGILKPDNFREKPEIDRTKKEYPDFDKERNEKAVAEYPFPGKPT